MVTYIAELLNIDTDPKTLRKNLLIVSLLTIATSCYHAHLSSPDIKKISTTNFFIIYMNTIGINQLIGFLSLSTIYLLFHNLLVLISYWIKPYIEKLSENENDVKGRLIGIRRDYIKSSSPEHLFYERNDIDDDSFVDYHPSDEYTEKDKFYIKLQKEKKSASNKLKWVTSFWTILIITKQTVILTTPLFLGIFAILLASPHLLNLLTFIHSLI